MLNSTYAECIFKGMKKVRFGTLRGAKEDLMDKFQKNRNCVPTGVDWLEVVSSNATYTLT